MRPKVLTVCLNPTIQRTLLFDRVDMGEVNRARKVWVDASGKGVNAARVAAQLGAEAVHLTHSGGAMRDFFAALCTADGIRLVAPDSESEIRTCVTIIEEDRGSATELVEEAEAVGPGTESALRDAFATELPLADALIISGSRAPGYCDTIFPWMTGLAIDRGAIVLLDLRGPDLIACLDVAGRVDKEKRIVAKPNRKEFLDTFGAIPLVACGRSTPLEELVRDKARQYRVAFLVTDGAAPAVYCTGDSDGSIAIPVMSVMNPIGSGDACAAGVACAMANGVPLLEAFEAGVLCGTMNAAVARPGRLHD